MLTISFDRWSSLGSIRICSKAYQRQCLSCTDYNGENLTRPRLSCRKHDYCNIRIIVSGEL